MFEYLFFFNANIIFTQKIFPKEFIPFKNDLLVVMHPGYFSSLKNYLFPLLPFERNIKSTAYIPYWCKSSYYMGGINGGKSNYFLKMIEDINFNIKEDLKNGIIAKWHDESHLNKYLINKNKKVLLPNIFGYPEEKIINETPKIIILNKNKFGGHNKLREK